MTKASELREMSDEQLALTLKDTVGNLFHLRLQAQTERLDAPSELRKQRRLIARIKTLQNQRRRRAERTANVGRAEDKAAAVVENKTATPGRAAEIG